MADVQLRHISKSFGSVTALNDVTFNIADGEFFVLLGPTGAGKTTTLRVIAGLTRQDQGSVLFDDQPIDAETPADRDVAFVFQQYSLYPTMTVYDNLAFPLRAPSRKVPEAQINEQVRTTADILRIGHLLERKTGNLSGGEMQRVSIGRAIVRQPKVYLMDEPLSNLDAKLRESLRVELQHIQKTQGSTTLFVTHDQVEALTMADRIAVLNQGQILQIGSPFDIYDRPATIFVAQLVGSPRINLMSAGRENGMMHVDKSPIKLPLDGAHDDMPANCQVGIRPEDIQPQADGEFDGEVMLTEPLGVETVLHIRTGQITVISTISGVSPWKIGDKIGFNIVRDRLHYFDVDGIRI